MAKVIDISNYREDMHPSEWAMFVSLATTELEHESRKHDAAPTLASKTRVLEIISEAEELLRSMRQSTNKSI